MEIRPRLSIEGGGDSSSPAKKTLHYIVKQQDEKMNFKRWVICLIAIANMIMSPMITFMGYQAKLYGLSSSAADRALMIIGVIIFMISLLTLFATTRNKKRELIFVLFSDLVIIIFLSIFTLGIFSFTPDMRVWLYDNWDQVRNNMLHINYNQFENTLYQNILSLGVFALAINIGIIISSVAIVYLITLKKTLKAMLYPLNLLLIVFSTALVMISVYSQKNADFVNIPTWMNNVILFAGIFVTFAAAFGYYANLKTDLKLLRYYSWCLMAIIIFVLIAVGGYFFISARIDDIVDDDWPVIYSNLSSKGYNVTKKVFIEYFTMNLKFAGIYGFMYSLFLVMTFFATLHKLSLSM